MKKQTKLILTITLLITSTFFWQGYSQYKIDRLEPNQTITINQGLRSTNGMYNLIMQQDGNLCIYKNGTEYIWCAMTNNNQKNNLMMQPDGNLVIYNQMNQPIWSTDTHVGGIFKQGKILIMQNDGNLVLYNANNKPVWASKSGKL